MVKLAEQVLKLATFNIRYEPFNPSNRQGSQIHISNNGEAPWTSRLPLIIDQIKWERPDIIGFQEALEHQYKDLKDELNSSHYSSIGVGRDNGAERGEFVPLFWRSDKFKSLSTTHFWLSDLPDVPGSIGWDAGQTRMVTVVHFQPLYSDEKEFGESDRSFYVMNTHFDDRGAQARTESAKLILKRANEMMNESGRPIVLMGDFNAPSSEEAYQVLIGHESDIKKSSARSSNSRWFKDCRNEVARKYGASEATFTGFDGNPNVAQVIDYILILRPDDKSWKTLSYGVIPNQFSHQQPLASDHRLVCALLNTRSTASCA